MASYRPFPPQSTFPPPPKQNPLQPPQQQRAANQYNQNWGYGSGSATPVGGEGSVQAAPPAAPSFPQNFSQPQHNSNYHHSYPQARPHQPPPPPNQQYSYPPPPPPPESSFPPPPPPPPSANIQSTQPQPTMYYQNSQYPQYNNQPGQPMQPPPPPPPSSPPPSSSIPPPPPSSPPPPPPSAPSQAREGRTERGFNDRDRGVSKGISGRREHGHSNHGLPSRQQKPPVPPLKRPHGRVETEEERRVRKKREFDKVRQEEKQRHQMKESQNTILQKTQIMSSGKGHESIVGSRMGERRTTAFLSGERIENRLKKPTTFLCKLKFRNELPDPSAQMKLMALKREEDQYTRYTISSLEKQWKPKLFVEPDLGIPLDLLDLSVYNPPSVRAPLAPEDEELLLDDEAATPIKKDGIRRKDRPTDKGVSWLVKTQYISPLSMESTKQSLTEKQSKELRERKGGRSILDNRSNRDRQIKEIEASFEACKSRPVHATNKNLKPVEVLPLLPDFDRYDDQFAVVSFDGAPTADSEFLGKLDASVRDAHESKAVMKSYVATGSDPTKPEKFLAYMVPCADEISKNMYDEDEEISYSWVREYGWDIRGDDADDPETYLVSFDEGEARYVPLPTKLNLRKKRATEGRSADEVERFPVPSRVIVRQRPTAAVIEHRDPEVHSSLKGGMSNSRMRRVDSEDDLGRHRKIDRDHDHDQDMEQYSGAEDEFSD